MNILLFITNGYPYGTMESFIENEMPYLDEMCDRILFLPTDATASDSIRSIGKNGKILSLPAINVWRDGILLIWTLCKLILSPEFYKEIADTKRLTGSLKPIISWLPRWIIYSVRTLRFTESLKRELTADDSVYVYSYWFSFHALICAEVLKGDSRVKCRISRGHGFDIYVRKGHYPPLHRYILQRLDAVLPCSVQGEGYLCRQYPEFAEKIHASLLGTRDFGEQVYSSSSVFRLVSCSNLIDIKRVDRIIEALAQLDIPVEWTHYGDGPLREELHKLAEEKLSGKQVKVNWRGRLPNSALMKEYGEKVFDLFANVSDSEGLPVSIMEAMSFGIPCLATDVGGTKEVIDGDVGWLVAPEEAVEKLVETIRILAGKNEDVKRCIRGGFRENWSRKFRASENYRAFCGKYLF